jgi:hypothetical protein
MLPKGTPTRRRSATPKSRTPRKRRHLHLIDPADGAEILPDRRVYSDAQLTRWKIELLMDDPDLPEYAASFRADSDADAEEGDSEACVVFTLSLPGTDLYPLQVRIFENGEIEYESHIPLIFRIQSRKKTISVRLLATVRAVADGVAVTYKG